MWRFRLANEVSDNWLGVVLVQEPEEIMSNSEDAGIVSET